MIGGWAAADAAVDMAMSQPELIRKKLRNERMMEEIQPAAISENGGNDWVII
jgi:hypothetical protein